MRAVLALFLAAVGLFAGSAYAQTAPAPAAAPALPPISPENIWYLDLSDGGRVVIALRPDVAPQMVARVKTLTRQHFYDGLDFHRVIDGFMAQGGDPKGDGTGGSTLPNVPAEFSYLPHVRGAVAAARAEDKNSANSQFYIMFQPKFALDQKYTVFGRVVSGMEYVDAIHRGEPPANPTKILHAYIAADNPPAYQPAPMVPVASQASQADKDAAAAAILAAPSKPAAAPAPRPQRKPR